MNTEHSRPSGKGLGIPLPDGVHGTSTDLNRNAEGGVIGRREGLFNQRRKDASGKWNMLYMPDPQGYLLATAGDPRALYHMNCLWDHPGVGI